jgi:hypothetical protein
MSGATCGIPGCRAARSSGLRTPRRAISKDLQASAMTAPGRCAGRAASAREINRNLQGRAVTDASADPMCCRPPLVPVVIFALALHCTRRLRAVFAATSIGSGAAIAASANRALVFSLIFTSARCSARGRTPDARADFRTFSIDPRALVIARLDTLFDNVRRADCACRQQSPNSGQQIVKRKEPPTPNPSPPRATRAGGGEQKVVYMP